MIKKLIAMAKEGGELLKEGYYKRKSITFKGVVDLMTEYDLSIELLLKERLKQEFSDFAVIGEETGGQIPGAKKAIYVDPIDGTTNFVHGIPFVAVSIGVWEEGEAVAGVVYNPIQNELFWAQKGKGAYLNDSRIAVSKATRLQESLIATGFPYTKVQRGRDFEWVIQTLSRVLPGTRDIRRLGAASLDLCYVAKGSLDGFYELNLKPWDVAAGILIVKEAKGRVSNDKNLPYRFNDIVVATNGLIHDELVAAIS